MILETILGSLIQAKYLRRPLSGTKTEVEAPKYPDTNGPTSTTYVFMSSSLLNLLGIQIMKPFLLMLEIQEGSTFFSFILLCNRSKYKFYFASELVLWLSYSFHVHRRDTRSVGFLLTKQVIRLSESSLLATDGAKIGIISRVSGLHLSVSILTCHISFFKCSRWRQMCVSLCSWHRPLYILAEVECTTQFFFIIAEYNEICYVYAI